MAATNFKILRNDGFDPLVTIQVDNPNLDEAMAELVDVLQPGTKVGIYYNHQSTGAFTVTDTGWAWGV